MNIMFQESITKKEKRLKRQRIFWIVVFWLMSICCGALCIDFFKTASNENRINLFNFLVYMQFS